MSMNEDYKVVNPDEDFPYVDYTNDYYGLNGGIIPMWIVFPKSIDFIKYLKLLSDGDVIECNEDNRVLLHYRKSEEGFIIVSDRGDFYLKESWFKNVTFKLIPEIKEI